MCVCVCVRVCVYVGDVIFFNEREDVTLWMCGHCFGCEMERRWRAGIRVISVHLIDLGSYVLLRLLCLI